MNLLKMRKQLQDFLLEDIGDHDLTSNTIFSENQFGEGTFTAKAKGVLAGAQIITETYRLLHPEIQVTLFKNDGDNLEKGDVIATVQGPVRDLLTGERVILNLMQRMSGIATLTKEAVTRLHAGHTKICDTRKTTPGLRMFEKYAVTCGGGYNHRFGLYDGVMIKDNHIAFCGSITEAVKKVREQVGHMVKIEVETESKEQVLEAVEAGADVIMLDNQTPEQVKQLVPLIPNTIISEASGNINLTNIAEYGTCQVDYISLGLLTHSATALDISLDVIYEGEKK
ncbi:carboxylating nicotinate-nucleotide diphosphorylase [Aquibacillus koreensis]|uniref:Probable nicotinate-nucleotide pyrophosphorylase [carboxylating] n=1 Tax=Aquibacillus koreensis TaxID=279446 RepID=A0A9X3WIT4_9BACI|nr:carboxylating nicotinate-nucleotide diphosphorylase [Aquibacillus koreensis]MCT2537973.1 carboxylating nicotinate-nucleotide diphosphorylase [Aquibacillus koreensis]MDC3419136.1 carboxylating nicotinate-nucleotide diphosphorylase [Aquibacillus koreensis]